MNGGAKTGRPPLTGPLPWIVAWRFLSGERSRLLGGTARSALAAVALGVTAMVIAMALMTGYREDLERKLIEGNAPIVASPLSRGTGPLTPEALARLEAIDGVERVGRVSYGQGALDVPGRERPGTVAGAVEVTLRGVDPGGGQLSASEEQLAPDADGVPGMVLGAELAARLGVEAGERVRLVALGFDDGGRPRFRFQSLRVATTFETGFAEFDGSWAVMDRALVNRLMGDQGAVDLYEFTLSDAAGDVARVGEEVRAVLEPDYLVTDWRQLNQELFTALRVQQYALFGALGLIVLVSTFNVASTLVVLVRERMRDLGVLLTLGLPPKALAGAFLVYGGLLGAVGTALGVAIGVGAAWTLTTFELIKFDAEVAAIYFISSVPFRVQAGDVLSVVAFSLLVTLAACVLPSRRALRIDPAVALRYE
ncbi:MAG TPA: ABC transporter permease [Thermoanaerobaculia bacterium]|nr:ABC transporter permease [Thermoanaerobaculia bacterium]